MTLSELPPTIAALVERVIDRHPLAERDQLSAALKSGDVAFVPVGCVAITVDGKVLLLVPYESLSLRENP
jgi:hypothetical protein